MKNIWFYVSVCLISFSIKSFAETEISTNYETVFGLSLAAINAGTGHGTGYTLNGSVRQNRKSLEVGIIYSEKERGLAGADIKFRLFPRKFDFLANNNFPVISFFEYNIIFQKSTSSSPEILELGGVNYELPAKPGKISTFSHFVNFGSQIWLFKQVYIDTSFGLGIYNGSLDQVNGPGTPGIHWQNAGLTYSYKIGLGYLF